MNCRVDIREDIKRYQDTLSYASGKVDYSMGQNIYMLPSDMNLKIKTGTVGYNNKILVSDEKYSLGKDVEVEIGTWGFWCSLRPLLHHTSSAHNSHSAPEPLSLSNCIKLWGMLVLVQYDANIWC